MGNPEGDIVQEQSQIASERRSIVRAPTREQKEILTYLGQGYSYKRIAAMLGNTESTCKGLMGKGERGIKHRLGIDNIFGCICYCLRYDFIHPAAFNPPEDLPMKILTFPLSGDEINTLDKAVTLGTDDIFSLALATSQNEQSMKNTLLPDIVKTLGAVNTRHAFTLYAVCQKMQGLL